MDGEELISNHQITLAQYRSHKPLTSLFLFIARQFYFYLLNCTAKMSSSCPPQSTVNCTLVTCSLSCAQVDYLPTLAGNALYAVAFGLLLIAQLGLGIKCKTWGFMIGMICGLLLEVVGYAGRIMLHNNPFDFNNFIM